MVDEERETLGAWVRDCGGYYMRFAEGNAGKLVRLDRVRQWLMAGDDGLPYVEAGETVLKPLEAAAPTDLSSWLYVANDGGYARPIRDDDSFEVFLVSYIGDDRRPNPTNCGVRGAIKHMREYWCESTNGHVKWHGQHRVEGLAVPVEKAHELYGWGTAAEEAPAADTSPFPLADWAALVKYRKANPRSEWANGDQQEILAAELDRRVAAGVNKSKALGGMAREMGLSDRHALEKVLPKTRPYHARKQPGDQVSANDPFGLAKKNASGRHVHKSK